MRRYDIYRLDGDSLIYIKRFGNRNKADDFMAHSTEKSNFYVMYYYVNYSQNNNWKFFSSILFLNGVPVKHSKEKIEADYILKFKQNLGRVYTTDGGMYYINNRQLTCQDVIGMIGDFGSVKVVQDEPERWVILYRDVTYIRQGKIKDPLPPLNKRASAKFGMTLYGDVIFINENYC